MIPLLIGVTAGLMLYFLLIGLAKAAGRKQAEVDARVLELTADKAARDSIRRKERKHPQRKRKSTAARTKKELEKLGNQIYDVGIRMSPQRFLTFWVAAAFGLPLLLSLLGLPVIIAAAAAFAIALGPILLLKLRKNKRRKQLEEQLVEAISVLVNALRAGHSFQQAMNSISHEMNGPIAEEFGRVFLETQHGMTMQDSFDRMVERTGSADLEMLCTAILIQRDVGGNLAEVLENISGTIQNRLKLKAEIKTRTASGRLSGYIVGALPILLLVAMSVVNPDYSSALFTTNAGHVMLGIGAAMEATGFLVIQKVVNIKY